MTQLTNKTTSVSLHKLTGQITMNNAALAAGAEVVFTVSNTLVAATDVIVLNIATGVNSTDDYVAGVGRVGTNSFDIYVGNVSAGSLSEAIVLNFAVIKGSSS